MNETRLRQWAEANPGRVNARDLASDTPLTNAASKGAHALVVWLLDEKGADIEGALHAAASLDILIALLDRGADPSKANIHGRFPLTVQAKRGTVEIVARLLQDSRVRATINMQDGRGQTALHWASVCNEEKGAASKAHLLFQAGADPTITADNGQTPLDTVRELHPSDHATIALLEQYPAAQKDAEKASLLVKARRLAVAATSNTVAPSCLQARVAQRQPLPRLALMPLTGTSKNIKEESRKCRGLIGFILGMEGGPMGEVMPADVFQGVFMDLLMP